MDENQLKSLDLLKILGIGFGTPLAIWGLGEGLAVLVPHMGIDTPLQIAGLIAFIAFTAAIVIVPARYMLKSKLGIFNDSNPDRLKLIVLLLFFFTIAGVMSFLLFNALTYGVAYGTGRYDRGKVHPVSQDPVFYWSLVVIYYSAAVAALSFGLAVGARLTRNWLTRKTGPPMNDLGMRQKVKLIARPLPARAPSEPKRFRLKYAIIFGGGLGLSLLAFFDWENVSLFTMGLLFMIAGLGLLFGDRPRNDSNSPTDKESTGTLDLNGETNDSPQKRFTRSWVVATIVYFAGAVIALYVYSKGDWGWDMPLVFLPAVFLAPIFVSLGLLAIYTNEFQLRGGTFYRSKNPIWYWVCVAMMLFLGIGMFLYGIGVIGPWNENLGRR